MCAIIGWSGKINSALLRGLFRRAESHGPHSVGMAYKDDDGSINVFKRAICASDFLRNHNHRVDRAASHTLGFGHTRYATHGARTDQNAHPFTHNGIVFCHNGIIGNYRSIKPDAVVDSECLGVLIERRNIAPAQGSTGAVWFEDGELYAYRHWQRLMAATFTFSGDDQLTIVATVQSIIPQALWSAPFVTHVTHSFREGTAYRVSNSGVQEAWSNPDVAAKGQLWCSPSLSATGA